MYDDKLPLGKLIGWLLVFFIFIGAFGLVGWRVGWIFAQKNADFQAHVIRHGFSNQQTLRDEITKNMGDVSTITVQIAQVGNSNSDLSSSLRAQRYAVVGIVCHDADQITGDSLPADQQQFVQANCLNGSVSVNSNFNSQNG